MSVLHLQAGNMIGLGGDGVRMLDDFKMGPNLVRGFQPAGIGPRDITPGTSNDVLGGTMYWGASFELQYPFYFLPKDSGFRGAVFVDAGSVWGYKGETQSPATGEINGLVNGVNCQCGMQVRRQRGHTHVGRRQPHLGFAIRSAAFRFRLSDLEAGVRPHPVVRLRRRNPFLIAAAQRAASGMPDFLRTDRELTIGEIAELTQRQVARRRSVRPAHRAISRRWISAGPSDISFLDNPKYLGESPRRAPARAWWRRVLRRGAAPVLPC